MASCYLRSGWGRGSDRAAPSPPLFFVLATIPFIRRIQRENRNGNIKPVKLGDQVTASITCLADDTAIFMEIEHQSWDCLFQQLALLEVVSGARVNKLKSKLLIIGKTVQFPEWATQAGVQRVHANTPQIYLGALAMTDRKGVDDSERILGKVNKTSLHYSAFRLPLESRVIAFRGAVFPTLIYPLMTAAFKKGTFKKLDVALRRFVWATNAEGKDKPHLAAWNLLNIPDEVGGLGLFQLQHFQGALFCKAILRAIDNPRNSLWAPVLAESFLKVGIQDFATALCLRDLPGPAVLGPVSSLLIKAWGEFISKLRWLPDNPPQWQDADLKNNLFLIGRGWWSSVEARGRGNEILRWCRSKNLNSLSQIKQKLTISPEILNSEMNEGGRRLLQYIMENEFQSGSQVFMLMDWKADRKGGELQSSWRTSKIYNITRADEYSEQGRIMNERTGLNWPEANWKVLKWAAELNQGRDTLQTVWLLAITWRRIWAERCVLKYEGKENKLHWTQISLGFLEEIYALRKTLNPDLIHSLSSTVIAQIPIVPQRYKRLIEGRNPGDSCNSDGVLVRDSQQSCSSNTTV
ncbi:hypothetical protein R1sor_004401 [Riccia sorocarpa]|uniref:Reverse transcriptase n=1 Tax=Riccia sorocarpa TaxID=122646 RepID=A0ABD3HGM8_9MARC